MYAKNVSTLKAVRKNSDPTPIEIDVRASFNA
jgi:hypothetical protein